METTTTEQGTLPVLTSRKFYTLKARDQWVVIRMVSREEIKSEGGIVIKTAQAKTQHGVVEDVDKSVVKDLEVGQHVVFTNFVTTLEDIEELTGRRDLYLVRSEEVYARAEEITDPAKLAVIQATIAARYASVLDEESGTEGETVDEKYKRVTGKA